MKSRKNWAGFAVGLMCGAVIFGGAGYAAGVVATPLSETSQKVTLDGQEVSLEGYNINGNSYFKLRDVGKAVDFGVTWDNATRTVQIDTNSGYVEEQKPSVPGAVSIPTGDASWCPPVGTVIDLGNGQTMTVTKAKDPEPELTVPANASSFWQDELPLSLMKKVDLCLFVICTRFGGCSILFSRLQSQAQRFTLAWKAAVQEILI